MSKSKPIRVLVCMVLCRDCFNPETDNAVKIPAPEGFGNSFSKKWEIEPLMKEPCDLDSGDYTYCTICSVEING